MNCILGWPNLVLSSTLAVSSQEATLPGTNLTNDQGSSSMAWQTTAGVTNATMRLSRSGPTTWRAFGLFRTNLTASATVSWSVLSGGSVVYAGVSAALTAGYGQSVHVADADHVGDAMQVTVSDPTNPDGHLNIPLAFAGPAWQPDRNFDYTSAPGRTDQRTKSQTRAGGVVIRPDWVKRVFDLSMSGVRAAEVWSKLMDLDLYARRGNNVLFVPNPLSATIASETLFGEFEPSGGVTYPQKTGDVRGYRATITERL